MEKQSADEIIRAGLEAWQKAAHARDIDAMAQLYTPDAVAFDVIGPLRDTGRDAIRTRMAHWFDQFTGPVQADFQDVKAYYSGDLAVGIALTHVTGDLAGGGHLDILSRVTVVMQHAPEGWRTVHEHVSVPFNPMTGQASTKLQP